MLKLSEAVPSNTDLSALRATVEFKGLQFEIKYVSRSALASIGEQCVVMAYSAVAKGRQRSLDPDKFNDLMAKAIIAGWSKVTPRTLSKVMPLDLKKFAVEDLDTEIPFDLDEFKVVLKNSPELDDFLQQCSSDPATFRDPLADEKVKN